MALGRKNSQYLGMFPRGAFRDAADRGHIIGVADSDRVLAGYLLYRVSRGFATIVHLCVDPTRRQTGVARALFEELKRRTQECHGVRLWCRRDFPANSLWPKLGFLPMAERAGRSMSGALLVAWEYPYGHPTLFTAAEAISDEHRALTALDANIIFDLQDKPDIPQRGIGALSADWLSSEVEFCVTSEIYHEINRAKSGAERERRRHFVSSFRRLSGDPDLENTVRDELRPLFPGKMSESDESDLEHLVKSIAGSAKFFVTRDTKQLGRADEVLARYGLAILTPLELVVRLDAQIRGAEYVPARVAGTLSTMCRVGSEQLELLGSSFQNFKQRELKTDFEARLLAAVSDPLRCGTYTFTDSDGELAALYAFDGTDPTRLVIPLLRIRQSRLTDGFTHHILWKAITKAADEGRFIVEVTEPYLSVDRAVLEEIGFVHEDGAWRKYVVSACGSRAAVLTAIRAVSEATPTPILRDAQEVLSDPESVVHNSTIAHLERLLWPAKITNAGISNYIIPIRPVWAAHLFDEYLANQDLFGAAAHVAMSIRNVYFRKAHPPRINNPARVLWYVSNGKGWDGTGSIRASSLIDESIQGPAKELFSRFRRLGAYEWRQVLETADHDPFGQLMAFSFTHTKLFPTPVSWSDIQRVLIALNGRGNPLAGPVQISGNCFGELYHLGTATA